MPEVSRFHLLQLKGKEFSLLKFHNELLNHGTPPVRLLREIMLKDKAKWKETL